MPLIKHGLARHSPAGWGGAEDFHSPYSPYSPSPSPYDYDYYHHSYEYYNHYDDED